MAANTKISWATHTFNFVLGCTKIASGCAHCYAAEMAGRLGVKWGPNGTRRRTAASTWRQVEKWDRDAYALQCHHSANRSDDAPRPRVFPSLCDPFEDWQGPILTAGDVILAKNGRASTGIDRMTMDDVRRDFFALIDRTPNLDWLLLTKRPENIRRMWPFLWGRGNSGLSATPPDRSNVWLVFSASDQASLDAGLSHLLECRDLSPVLGLSLEPLLGPIDLDSCFPGGLASGQGPYVRGLDWVIIGGESGPKRRPMELNWMTSLAEQCKAANVPLFVKQDGAAKSGQQGRISDELWACKEFPWSAARR